jgi:hypothetical protein
MSAFELPLASGGCNSRPVIGVAISLQSGYRHLAGSASSHALPPAGIG